MAENVTQTELDTLNEEQNAIATVSDTETTYTGKFVGTLVGNATTAKELEAPYRLTLTGDVSGTTLINASDTNLAVTVTHAKSADTADFAGKTNLSARSSLADMANTAEFAYHCGKLTKLFVNITGACVGSGSATDSDTIDINIDNINVGELFVVGKLPDLLKADTSRIYADIPNRHFWIYNSETGKWYDCFEQLESELDNHELRITDLENLDLSNRVTSLETRATKLEGRATNLESRATDLENRATAVETRATKLEQRADTNDIEHADFEKRITKNTADISDLDTRVKSIEDTSDIGVFATRMTAVENKNTEQDEKIAEQGERIAELAEITVTDATSVDVTALAKCTGVMFKATDLINVSTDIDGSSISGLSISDSEPDSATLSNGSAVIYPSVNSI